MATVLLLLDALRHDYVNEVDTPFLWQCSKEGEYYKKVIPSYGFCERAEILTGEKPNNTGFFTAIGYDPDNSPYKSFKYTFPYKLIESLIPKKLRIPGKEHPGGFYRLYRKLLQKIISRDINGMQMYNIPLELLSHFALTEDRIDHRDSEAFNVPSILSMLKEEKRRFFYDSFSALNLALNGDDDDRLQMVLNAVKKEEDDLYLVYIAAPDSIGHKFGPNSDTLKKALTRLDFKLAEFTNEFERIAPNSNYIYLGDHGMLPVESTFDPKKELDTMLRGLNLCLGEDYVYFLDSTIVRFWFNSPRAKDLLESRLRNNIRFLSKGVFVDDSFLRKEFLPINDRRYGHLVWMANPGVIVFPDFFHQSEPCKGMHGYSPDLLESQGTCIVYGANVESQYVESIPLTGVYKILKRYLNI